MRTYSVKEIKLVQSKLAKKEKGGRVHTGSSAAILHDPTVVVPIRISTGLTINIRTVDRDLTRLGHVRLHNHPS